MSNPLGTIDHTFTATGQSQVGRTGPNPKTIVIEATDAYVINAEVLKNGSWVTVETFTEASFPKNFEWLGEDVPLRFDCTTFTANDIVVSFE